MRGLILAGGSGTRLHPLTISISKHLLSVYNKPMIFYPLSTLMLAGIREIAIITNPEHISMFQNLLRDGHQFGIKIEYIIQPNPSGIAHSLIVADQFIEHSATALVLGDNIFHGIGLGRQLRNYQNISGALSFAHQVKDPRNYGVVEFDVNQQILSLEEKPSSPRSNFAVTGLYFLDHTASAKAKSLIPSARGELEILDLLKLYLLDNKLNVSILPRGTAWLDTGTFDTLHDASSFVRITEERTGLLVGDPFEVAKVNGWI